MAHPSIDAYRLLTSLAPRWVGRSSCSAAHCIKVVREEQAPHACPGNGAVGRSLARRSTRFVLREEELLSLELEISDRLLPGFGDQPIDECLPVAGLHVPVFGGIDQNDAVLVEQTRVSLHED